MAPNYVHRQDRIVMDKGRAAFMLGIASAVIAGVVLLFIEYGLFNRSSSAPERALEAGPQDEVSALLETLGSGEEDARIRAAKRLAFLGPEAKPRIAEIRALLEKQDSTEVKVELLRSIVAIDPKYIKKMLSNLRDGDYSVRLSTVKVLGALGEDAKPAGKDLFRIYADESEPEEIRYAAARSLGHIDVDFVGACIGGLSTGDRRIRLSSIDCLRVIGKPAMTAVQTLEEIATDDPDPEMRKAAARAIRRIASDER